MTTTASSRARELYDPATGVWTATDSLLIGRASHAATLANGKALITGGANTNNGALASAELYDPLSATWSSTRPLNAARQAHTATLLADGKVLVAAGSDGDPLASAELTIRRRELFEQ